MPGPDLPRSDRVVVALWREGAVEAAIEMATHALARAAPARAALHAQLDRLRAGEGVDDEQSVPSLDFQLAIAMVERYRFHEAACLLRALGLSEHGAERLGALLDEALAPFPEEADPSFAAVLGLVRAGQAPSALRALEEVLQQTVPVPAWLSDRCHVLSGLVGGDWWRGPASVEQVTADTVLARLRKRDLVGALEAAERADAVVLAAVLRRLLEETRRPFSEAAADAGDGTMPVEGRALGAFHLRMGMLSHAEAVYRRLIREEGDDDGIRALLADVIALRRALGEDAKPMPPRKRLSVHWLSKNKPKRAADWGAGSGRPSWDDDDALDETTEVLDASQEAELLLQLGKAGQALDMYRILAIRHPNKTAYARRIEEIEALIEDRLAPVAAEVTAHYDLSELGAAAVPTNPHLAPGDLSERYPVFDDRDEAETTEMDAVSWRRRDQRKKPK